MIIVRESAPYDLPKGLGAEYQARICVRTARKLAGVHPLPRIGFELILQSVQGNFGFRRYLTLSNISGDFYLSSAFVAITEWPQTFGVEIKRCIPI